MLGIKTRCSKTWGHFGGNNNFVASVFLTIPVLLVGKGVPESPTNVRVSVESKRQPRGGRLEKLDTIFRAKTGEFLGCW